jgi:hypothetical protein
MKSNIRAFYGTASVLAIALLSLAFIIARPALAQVDATSTETVASSSEPASPTDTETGTIIDTGTATTAADDTDIEMASGATTDATSSALSTTTAPAESPPAATSDLAAPPAVDNSGIESSSSPEVLGVSTSSDVTPDASRPATPSSASPEELSASSQPPPEGLTLVHITGTKYIDYFTDGTTVTQYPGDPTIDAHLAEKDAPTPTHEGLTWVHTVGMNLYDTPSGDLEQGDYAVQSDGSYIDNPHPTAFVSSTSTPATSDAITSDSSSTSSTIPADISASTDEGTSSAPTTSDSTATTTE